MDGKWLTSDNAWVEIFEALGIEQTHHYNENPVTARRILVVCRGGNCRSVAVGFLLKYKYKHDAMSISLEKNSPGTWHIMSGWAEEILTLQQQHYDELVKMGPTGMIPKKLRLLDLGDMERLRAHPFEIGFLKRVDKLLGQHLSYSASLD